MKAPLGWLMMPLRNHIPQPGDPGWKLTTCPECGRECWERPLPGWLKEGMFSGALCTECALRKGREDKQDDTEHGTVQGH